MDGARSVQPQQQKKKGFSGWTKANNYKVDVKRFGVFDVWNHFLKRGHSGRVTCVDVNANSEYVVTGGVDWTMRVWKYSYIHRAYDLAAVVNIPVPSPFAQPRTDLGGCLSCLPFCAGKINWDDEAKQGVTCITITHSLQELKGADESLKELYANGPIVGGTAEGSLYVLDFSLVGEAVTEEHGVFCKKGLHAKPIDDVGMMGARKVYQGQQGPDLFVITSSEDTTSAVLTIRTQRVQNPWKHTRGDGVNEEQPHGCFLDMLFFGRGFRNSCKELDLKCLEEGGKGEALGNAMGLMTQDAVSYEEPDECLKIIDVEPRGTLQHAAPVFRGHVLSELDDTEDELRCAFITCTVDGAHLWTKGLKKIMTLCIDGPSKVWDFSSSRRTERMFHVKEHIGMARRKTVVKDSSNTEHSQAVIFLSGVEEVSSGVFENRVGVWGLKDGYVGVQDEKGQIFYSRKELKEAMTKTKSEGDSKSSIMPLCIYEQKGVHIDVDQSGPSVSFAVNMLDRETVGVWRTEAVSPNELVLEPDDALNLLRCPGREEIIENLKHASNICDLRVAANPEGPVLVTACNDSSVFLWDLEGPDAGQVISNIRSMTVAELLLPPALLLITGGQMISFAFGPQVPWQTDVHSKAKVAHNVMMFDFKYTVQVDKELIFWPEMGVVCSVMFVFVFSALIGLPEIVDRFIHKYCNSDFYKDGGYCGLPNHVYGLLMHLKGFVLLLLQLCSTVFLVPMMKLCATAVDCMVYEDNELITLAAAPNVECYKGDHLNLVILLACMVPAFLFCVMPFAVVLGDANYVPVSCLYDYKFWNGNNSWRLAAARKAAAMHRGVMGFRPRRAFISLFTETIAKILLPCVATWTTRRPMEQAVLIALIGFVQWLVSILYPQYLERKFTVLVQNVKFVTLVAMLSGVLTVVVNDPTSFLPLMILGGCWVLSTITAIIQLACMQAVKPEVTIFNANDSREYTTKEEGRPLLANE